MLENLLYVFLLVLGVPTGLILSSLCKEELKAWKKRLFVIVVACLITIILLILIEFSLKTPIIISLFFIIITNIVIIWKSGKNKRKMSKSNKSKK